MARNSAGQAVVDKYGNKESFMVTFNPDHVIEYTNNLERVFFNNAPSFGSLKSAYGSDVPEAWIMIQLEAFTRQTNDGILDTRQMETIAKIISNDFYYIKVTEFMYFIRLYESGRFGHFYGRIDTLTFMENFRKFISIRFDEMSRLESRRNAEKSESDDGISYEEYLKKGNKPNPILQEMFGNGKD